MNSVSSKPYCPSLFFRNPHVQTIYPRYARSLAACPEYTREEFTLSDGDFIDLDWLQANNPGLVVLCHGLEGSSQSHYVRGMALFLHNKGFDICCPNWRGCSGRPNTKPYSYHSGKSADLRELVNFLASLPYSEIHLIGFSAGGNITLKYLGEAPTKVPARVRSAIAFAVPCDLGACARHLEKFSNWIYLKYFLSSLKEKVRQKALTFPEQVSTKGLASIRTIVQFDDRYTAPLNGFESAEHYYRSSSSNRYLPAINIPVRIISAQDDPFLPDSCYPKELAQVHPFVSLELPRYGGHIGFIPGASEPYWSELRALEILSSHSLQSGLGEGAQVVENTAI